MAKLHLYYNFSDSKSAVLDVLRVKINDKIELQVGKYEKEVIELKSGAHNVKMYVPWMGGSFGYTDENIEIQNEDVFYYYKLPSTASQKGKFVKLTNEAALDQLVKLNKAMSKIPLVIVIIIVVLFVVFWFSA